MLYTGRGDKGTTSHLGSATRVPKNDPVIEALGSLDELNALIGICKIKTDGEAFEILERIQQDLFIIQAELAGAHKHISADKVTALERVVSGIEERLPPIQTFFIAGGTELATFLDYARTVSRRTERVIVGLAQGKTIADEVLAYMNRLSSVLYALARLTNNESGITEKPPTYE